MPVEDRLGKIGVELFMTIFQHQSRPYPNCYNKGNVIENPHLIRLTVPWLKMAEIDDEESRQSSQHPDNH